MLYGKSASWYQNKRVVGIVCVRVIWVVSNYLFYIRITLRLLPTFQHNTPIYVIRAIKISEVCKNMYEEVHGSTVQKKKSGHNVNKGHNHKMKYYK